MNHVTRHACLLVVALATTSCSVFTSLGDLFGGKDDSADATRAGAGDRAGAGNGDELGADPFAKDAAPASAATPPRPVPTAPVAIDLTSDLRPGVPALCTAPGDLVAARSPVEFRAKACNLGSATAEDGVGAGLGSGASGLLAGVPVSSCISLSFDVGTLSRVRVRLRATSDACGTFCTGFAGGQCDAPSALIFVGVSAVDFRLAGTVVPQANFADYEVDVPVDVEKVANAVAVCAAVAAASANLIEIDAVTGVCD
jgi:hypothetical protein